MRDDEPERPPRPEAMSLSVASVFLSAMVLSGCPSTPCTSEPLTPAADARWVARYNEAPPPPEPPLGIPGIDEVPDPPGLGTYAALALFDGTGALLNERWLDGFVQWEEASGWVDAAAYLPTQTGPSLTLLLATGSRPVARFDLATGTVDETPVHAVYPSAGGQLIDLAAFPDGTALATRAEDDLGGGRDLVRVDGFQVQDTLALAALSLGVVEPGRIAALSNETAVVGLSLPDEPNVGAVAWVDGSGRVDRIDVPELTNCADVASFRDADRVAILCAGDVTAPPRDRMGAGFAILELSPTGPPRFVTTRPASTLFPDSPPTRGLVALEGGWVAAVSGGTPLDGQDDVLYVVDLEATDGGSVLWSEAWTPSLGAALGAGDFLPSTSELWWPSATSGVLRWSKDGRTFTPLPNAAPPTCLGSPPRVVRALPAG